MKRLLLAFGLLCVMSAPSWAVCAVTNLQVKDNAAVTAAVPYADDGSGASNCSPQIQIKQGGNVAAVTAGSALKVDNSAVTQPVSGTVTANAGTGNFTVVNAGTFASQVNGFTSWGGGTLGAMANYGTSPGAVLVPGVNAFVTNTNANGQATMANSSPVTIASNQSAVLVTQSANPDPCSASTAKTNFALASAAGNVQVVGGVAAKKVYICSISLVAAATAVVNFIEGTGAACTTANEAAVIGSTTAASGMSLAANGGFTLGNGAGTVAVTATAANGICILQSGTTALAGNVTYVQQ